MRKDEQMVFRVSSNLKAEFQEAAGSIGLPASRVLREFMLFFAEHVKRPKPTQLQDPTIAARHPAIGFGRASAGLERIKVCPEAEAIQQRTACGELSLEECTAVIMSSRQLARDRR
jgi:hypothetical protein